MPTLARASPEQELKRLIRIYLRAETDIINEIGRLRSRGLVDYHAVAALERVQAILRQLEADDWEYVPRLVESQFYVRRPETRAVPGETAEKHRAGYRNAKTLTGTQTDVVQKLTMNLMGQLTDAHMTVLAGLQSALLGRTEPDIYRRVGLEQVAAQQAAGRSISQSVPAFVDALRRDGVTAFTDKAGRNWSLHTYATMVSRTTSRQAEILSVITADPEQDLYQISAHGTTCRLCAPYEGRVYSKSGKDPDFPPLSDAFGKVDPDGADDLSNSWLNIHPNCLHSLRPWTAAGRTPEELERIKHFSSPKTNPYSRDPRTKAQIDAYRAKEKGRAKWLREYRQWEKYRTALGDQVPKTFETFQRHKLAGDEKYQGWVKAYREANKPADSMLLQKLNFADNVPTAERESIEKELSVLPQWQRDKAESIIDKVVMTSEEDSGSGYYYPTKTLYLHPNRADGDVIHEYGHALEISLDLVHNEKFLQVRASGINIDDISQAVYDEDTFEETIWRLENPKLISLYQGRMYESVGVMDDGKLVLDSMLEYFSEGFRAFYKEPDLLKEKDASLYDFIGGLSNDVG